MSGERGESHEGVVNDDRLARRLINKNDDRMRLLLRSLPADVLGGHYDLERGVARIEAATTDMFGKSGHPHAVVRLRRRDGKSSSVLVLEHKRAPEKGTSKQMLKYVRLHALSERDADGKLERVIPVVLYNGPDKWNLSCDFADLFRKDEGQENLPMISGFYRAVHFADCDMDILAEDPILHAGVMALVHGHEETVEPEVVDLLARALDDSDDGIYLMRYVARSMSVTASQMRDAIRRLEIGEGERTRKETIVGTLAMDMIKTAPAETIHQLRPEIRADIRAAVEAEILMKQLKSRFDRLPSWVPDRIASADSGDMTEWTEAILTANSVEDVFSSGKRGK